MQPSSPEPSQPASNEDLWREVEELKQRVEVLERRLQQNQTSEWTPPVLTSAAATAEVANPKAAEVAETPHREADLAAGKTPTLESRIGAQLFNRIGIFAVLAAAAWFLKLAIDREWIGPGVRILIGLAFAAGLMVWAERFRRAGTVNFSYTLNALASGVAYLSLWACFSLYQLLPAWVVFLMMAAVTITNAALAVLHNSELLAALALAGGLATPALLATGDNHELFLFSYLFLLDIGALALATLRPWPRLFIGAFIGTAIYFASWSGRYFLASELTATSVFLGVFFVLFTAAPFLSRRRTSSRGLFGSEILAIFPVPVGVCTFFAAYYLVEQSAAPKNVSSIMAMVTALLGAIYIALVIVGLRGSEARTLQAVHLGLAVACLAVAGLLGFHGYGIDVCWVMELAVIAGTAFSCRAMFLARPLLGNCFAMLVAASCALFALPVYDRLPYDALAFANPHFATYLFGLVVLGLIIFCGRQVLSRHASVSAHEQLRADSWPFLTGAAVIAFNLITLLSVSRQIELFWSHGVTIRNGTHPASIDFSYSIWFLLYGAALMAVGFQRRSAFLRWQALILLTLSIGKVFLFDTSHLAEGFRVASFLGLGLVLLGVSYVYQRDLLGLRGSRRNVTSQ
jgi:uncharacterized membrane protein